MSVSADEVKKLAELSRIQLSDAEVVKLQGEITSIISYIDTIQKVAPKEATQGETYFGLENVMREDEEPHESGIYTAELLMQAPKREGNYLKVKKILP